MSLEVVPFGPEHLADAASLLATSHTRHRTIEPALPIAYEDSVRALEILKSAPPVERGAVPGADAAASPAAGVAALRDGRLAGYLVAQLAVDFYEREAVVLPQGSAVAEGEGTELYRDMYAEASRWWVQNGYFVHYVHHGTCDERARHAWFSLGFGLYSVYNHRDISPLAGREAEVVIRKVGAERLQDEEALRTGLRRYNASSPILHSYIPRLGGDGHRIVEAERAAMGDPAHAYFIAYEGEKPAGLMIFTPPQPGYMLTPEGAGYLHIAYVDESAREGGIGTALVNRGLAWMRDQGYTSCTLGYYSPNLLGARFWQSNGFRPIGYCLERRIEDRIAWAQGAASR
jgi:GNAT superfamily N-acetyltransferase